MNNYLFAIILFIPFWSSIVLQSQSSEQEIVRPVEAVKPTPHRYILNPYYVKWKECSEELKELKK